MGGCHQPHYFCLDGIGILVFINHDIPKTGGNLPLHMLIFLQHLLQVDQEVIVIHQAVIEFELLIMVTQQDYIAQKLLKMFKLIKEQAFQVRGSVDRFADHIEYDPFGGKTLPSTGQR